MFWDYSGMAILDQRSFLTGRIGSQAIRRQHHHLGRRGASAANRIARSMAKACARMRVPLVENGVVKRVVYARATASAHEELGI